MLVMGVEPVWVSAINEMDHGLTIPGVQIT